MKTPYIIVISGNSCTGKSTLIKELQKKLIGSYHIGYDRVKWWLGGYDRDRDRKIVKDILSGFIETLLEKGISCITDSTSDESRYTHIEEFADKHTYKILSIHLECPLDIRLERFRDRVVRWKKEGIHMTVTDESVFLESAKKSFYFPENSLVFDTSEQKSEDIAREIIQKLE